jgi:FMN reductase
MEALRIVGLGGSLAQKSRNRAALQAALAGAAGAGAETEPLDIRELDLPMYNSDAVEPTEAASRLIDASYGADGMLWSSPLYQGTIARPNGQRRPRRSLAPPCVEGISSPR